MRQPPGTRAPRRAPASVRPRRQQTTLNIPLLAAAGGVVLLILIWLLLLPPFSLLRGGSGWSKAGEGTQVREVQDAPKPPPNYELASPYYEIRLNQQDNIGPAMMTIPLGSGKPGRGLSLFTWTGDQWKRLGAADVTPDGRSAQGQVDQVPGNVAVMRRSDSGTRIIGIAPSGASLAQDAAPIITVRSPADYTPAPDGTVAGKPSPRPQGEDAAYVPVVRADSGAEADAVNQILGSDQTRAAHVNALAQLVQTNKLDGLDLAYTAIQPNQGASFTVLVTALADQLHKTGQTLTVTMPVPRREGDNWNTAGYDWKAIGAAADFVRLTAEPDQSIYRRVMRDALTYVTGQVDAKKVILTVSPASIEKSDQGTRTLTELQALSIAAQINVPNRDTAATGATVPVQAVNLNRQGSDDAGLVWDATAASVSFVYQSGDALRTVWITNTFSTAFKLEFAQSWGLGGVAVDDASGAQGVADIWPAVDQYRSGQLQLLQPNSSLLRPQWLVDNQSAEVAKAVFDWKPQSAGSHTISLIVGDGVMRVVNSTKVTVQAGAAGPAPSPAGR